MPDNMAEMISAWPDYMAETRKLVLHYQFWVYLTEALQDRLVSWLRSKTQQKHLLAEQ